NVGVSDYTYFLGGINNLLSSGEKQLTLNLQNSTVSHLVVRMSSQRMLTNKHHVMVAVSL
ncbi:hypothetical protein GEW_13586, partial [Pasteurella multocida subsp. gallicida str. Anand1_poultry]